MVKVSIVIPVYKPEKEVFDKVKEMIKKQTIKAEVIENWNMPQAKSVNKGIKEAKGKIIVTLAQDCIPENKFWLEKLIAPLKDKKVVATVSDLCLTKEYWKTYSFLTRMFTINDRKIRKPEMDARACAYRKKDLRKMSLFDENLNIIAGEVNLYHNLKKRGEIVRSGCMVYHLHRFENSRKIIKTLYDYSKGNGQSTRKYGIKNGAFWQRIIRATPFLGFASMFYRFPFKKCWNWFPVYLLIVAPINNVINVVGFWEGFFSNKESSRNTEALEENQPPS